MDLAFVYIEMTGGIDTEASSKVFISTYTTDLIIFGSDNLRPSVHSSGLSLSRALNLHFWLRQEP